MELLDNHEEYSKLIEKVNAIKPGDMKRMVTMLSDDMGAKSADIADVKTKLDAQSADVQAKLDAHNVDFQAKLDAHNVDIQAKLDAQNNNVQAKLDNQQSSLDELVSKVNDVIVKVTNIDLSSVSDVYQQKINDIKQSLDDNFKRDELVKQLVEDHRLQMVELRRSIDENNRHDADIETVVKNCVYKLDMLSELKSRSDELKMSCEKIKLIDTLKYSQDNLMFDVSQMQTAIDRVSKCAGGVAQTDDLDSIKTELKTISARFEENKRITDERIEKLVKLFLSLNK